MLLRECETKECACHQLSPKRKGRHSGPCPCYALLHRWPVTPTTVWCAPAGVAYDFQFADLLPVLCNRADRLFRIAELVNTQGVSRTGELHLLRKLSTDLCLYPARPHPVRFLGRSAPR